MAWCLWCGESLAGSLLDDFCDLGCADAFEYDLTVDIWSES